MTQQRKDACKATIQDCEKALGRRLSVGEKSDLLLDNHMWIKDSLQSHQILKEIGEEF